MGALLLRTQPDGRLVRLFKDGSEPAFEELVRRYRSQLVAYAARISGAGHADDVVQDSLAAVYRVLGSQDVRELRPWLFAVVRNRAFDELSARRRRHEPLPDELLSLEDPAHTYDQRARLAAVLHELRELPARQRDALVKHEFEGRDYRSVAADLEVTVGAAKQLVYRARGRLRDTAAALIPPGLCHALTAPSAEVAAGAGGGGVGMLLKGGVATGLLASALVVGTAERHATAHRSRARVAQAGSVQQRSARSSQPPRQAAAAYAAAPVVPVAPHVRTLAAVSVRRSSTAPARREPAVLASPSQPRSRGVSSDGDGSPGGGSQPRSNDGPGKAGGPDPSARQAAPCRRDPGPAASGASAQDQPGQPPPGGTS